MTTTPTKGFQGEISWVAESAYGDGVDTADTLLLIANQVQSVRLSRNTPLGETRNIGSYDVATFIQGAKEYGITTEYLQDRDYSSTDCILARAIDRTSGELASLAFQVGVGTEQATSTWYNIKGVEARNVDIGTEEDGPVTVTIDWSVKEVATSSAKTATCSDTISTSPNTFVGGALKRGGSATWGYIVGSVSVTIDNGLDEHKDIGNSVIIGADAGARSGSASVDVCLTDGGSTFWTESENLSSDSLELDFGASSNDPSIRFASSVIGSLEIPLDSDSAIVKTTVPVTAAATSATANDAIVFEAVG